MADIFLSYTHADELRARPIVELLETQGWIAWWDRGIEPGMPWRPELDIELANCRALIVLWSHTSINSEWICREAQAGLRKEALVPILLDRMHFRPSLPGYRRRIVRIGTVRWTSPRRKLCCARLRASSRRRASTRSARVMTRISWATTNAFLCRVSLVPVAVLRYLHFTLVMNPRSPARTCSVNCDASQSAEAPPRKANWLADPLVPESLQMVFAAP